MPPTPPVRLRLETAGDVTVVSFVDEVIVDDLVLNEVRDALYRLVDVDKKKMLLLNLGNIRKYSTEFLGNLLGLKQRVVKANGVLKLCSIAPNLMDAVKILRLSNAFDIYTDEQDAIDAF